MAHRDIAESFHRFRLAAGEPPPKLVQPPDPRDDGSENLASNLRIPLWQLVEGSTGHTVVFPTRDRGDRKRRENGNTQTVEFIDGGITAYNNPSVIAFLMATLPCFPLRWEKGLDKLQVVSVGTGRCSSKC